MHDRASLVASFLRERRLRLKPADVGLPENPGRRVQGLRREEVAALAGVGITWYTWLEQGRPIRVAPETLSHIAGALRLDRDETDYLQTLVAGRSEPFSTLDVPPGLERLIHIDNAFPRLVVDAMGNVLSANAAYDSLVHRSEWKPPYERNAFWFHFTNPLSRRIIVNWRDYVKYLAAMYRARFALHVGDPEVEEFVDRLKSASSEFAELWAKTDVASLFTPTFLRTVDANGKQTAYERVALTVPSSPSLLFVALLPLMCSAVTGARDQVL